MNYLGDYALDANVRIFFTTHDKDGAPVAPSAPFEASDVKIYKNGSAAEKTTTNGLTMTSPFDAIVGLHLLVLDTSNNTGDAGFWEAASEYSVVLDTAKTVDGESVIKVIAAFSIERMNGAIARLKVQATTLSGMQTDLGDIEGKVDVVDNVVDQILIDTDITIPALIATLPSVADILAGSVEGAITLAQALRAILAYVAGTASGGGTHTVTFSSQDGLTDRIVMTVDANGNRSSVVLDLT
jgi:hypothetical protein